MCRIKFSIIGTGKITEKMINGGKLCDDFSLYGVYSRTEKRAMEFQEKFNIPNRFTDLSALAESETDAVYIASPTALHFEQALFMLQHKKHVLCEKPACSNARETEILLRTAKENGVVFLEAMRPVFSPGYALIRENLPKIGKVRHVTFSYCQYSSRYDNFKRGIIENAFRPELSNGALMDIGVYPLHVLISLFGKPTRVDSSSYQLEGSIDGCGAAILTYPDFLAEMTYSKISNSYLPCEIQGEKESILFSPVGTPTDVKLHLRTGETKKLNVPACEWDMVYEISAFCDMVLGKQNPDIYNRDTLNTLSVLDTIRSQNKIIFPADEKTLEK